MAEPRTEETQDESVDVMAELESWGFPLETKLAEASDDTFVDPTLETPEERKRVESVVDDVVDSDVVDNTDAANPSSTTTQVEDVVDYPEYTEREKMLLAQIEELRGITPVAVADNTADTSTATQSTTEPINFLENQDLDEVLSTPENFNKFMNAVYQRAQQDARALAAEQIMRNLPATIKTAVDRQIELRGIVQEFYDKNADLVPVKRTLAQVASEISAEHPEYDLNKVFTEAGTRVRKMLQLKSSAPDKTSIVGDKSKTKPFANSRSSGVRSTPVSRGNESRTLEDEVAELIAL